MSEEKKENDYFNMNYYFNKQYFDGLQLKEERGEKEKSLKITLGGEDSFEKRNKRIFNFQYQYSDGASRPSDISAENQQFQLTTLYPGLLMGTGYAHDLKSDDAIKCGFSFDYVTGLPYLPGSSLKGMLRSYFPDYENDKGKNEKQREKDRNKETYIKSIIEDVKKNKNESFNEDEIDITKLKKNIFDNGDVFLDVFPIEGKNGNILGAEFITPHNKGKFANPIPIKLLKVKPGVTFQFCFLLNDYKDDQGTVLLSIGDKLQLFKHIVLDMGIGAKTNVGFGKFNERTNKKKNKEKKTENALEEQEESGIKSDRKCATDGCKNFVTFNPKTGKPNKYCASCFEKLKKGK